MANVCVVGAGAIGGTIAARMALAGHQVSVVARGANLQAIRERGLTFDDRVNGSQHNLKLPASDKTTEFGVQDLVVVAVKQPQIASVLPTLAPLIGPETMVVPAINGIPWWYFYREGSSLDGSAIECLDPDHNLLKHVDGKHIIGCVVLLAGEVPEPGRVAHTASKMMAIGEPSNQVTDRVNKLKDWLNGSGFEIGVSPAIRNEIWKKATFNICFNLVSALTGYRTDEMMADPELADLMRAIAGESIAVAAACGVKVAGTPNDFVQAGRIIGKARSSMLQDLAAGRTPEIVGLASPIIEMATRKGVSAQTIKFVTAMVIARARNLGLMK